MGAGSPGSPKSNQRKQGWERRKEVNAGAPDWEHQGPRTPPGPHCPEPSHEFSAGFQTQVLSSLWRVPVRSFLGTLVAQPSLAPSC